MSDQKLIFLGSKEAGLLACKALLSFLPTGTLRGIICPDDTTDSRSELQNFRSLANLHGIPIHLVNRVDETNALIQLYKPDIAIIHGWYQLLPVENFEEIIFLGFHYSILPKYKGNAPLVWQIINGEEKLGVSFFQLTLEMDGGDLIDQEEFMLMRSENIGDALQKANEITKKMLYRFSTALQSDSIKLKRQPNESSSFCGMRIPEDGRIDWHKNASVVHDFIRAQSRPYAGAYTFMQDSQKIIVLKSAEENKHFYGVAGSIVEISSETVVVACGEGAIRLTQLEINGKIENSPRNILKSLRIRLG